MDVRIEAACMAAEAHCVNPVMRVVATVYNAIARVVRVASFSCPSLGSHSISAVAPDTNFQEGLANAA